MASRFTAKIFTPASPNKFLAPLPALEIVLAGPGGVVEVQGCNKEEKLAVEFDFALDGWMGSDGSRGFSLCFKLGFVEVGCIRVCICQESEVEGVGGLSGKEGWVGSVVVAVDVAGVEVDGTRDDDSS